uniref:EngC GTPase domain-containing protein n=1 Tax=Ananas comosus var. bracteatus TaxID=296719 RepID=A0A6V7Q0T4_ANACO|nr:unnamed protein product [Ananas comosus var. bracteatus]
MPPLSSSFTLLRLRPAPAPPTIAAAALLLRRRSSSSSSSFSAAAAASASPREGAAAAPRKPPPIRTSSRQRTPLRSTTTTSTTTPRPPPPSTPTIAAAASSQPGHRPRDRGFDRLGGSEGDDRGRVREDLGGHRPSSRQCGPSRGAVLDGSARPEPFMLTRFLVEAESTGIPFTLALNKVELVGKETLTAWDERLHNWGYNPLFCSVDKKSGLAALEDILKGQTTVIVGTQSISTEDEINKLLELNSKWFGEQRVGDVSKRSGRGKHTTRHVSLLPLSGGGFLADTPGFNQPSLMKVTKRTLAETFPEIRRMLKVSEPLKCSFNDCLHLGEPGCVVKADWERYPYYLQLLDEIKIREEFQLRTVGTKREGDVRYKMGGMGVKQAEPRLEPKKHRRVSRKRLNQSILNDLDELDGLDDLDDLDYWSDVEELTR